MASSGIQAAMAMLIKDKKESSIDSIQEDWADPGKIKIDIRGSLSSTPSSSGKRSVKKRLGTGAEYQPGVYS
jgi:hypothetical protein